MLTTVDANASLDRLRAEKTRAAAELVAARATLAAIESGSGARLLAARLAGDEAAGVSIRTEMTEARAVVADLEAIIGASDRAIRDAEKAVQRATAADIRATAAERWGEAEKRLQATAERLGQLFETEGIRWLPWPILEPSGVYSTGSWSRTSTGRLLAEILELELEAGRIETRLGLAPQSSLLEGVAGVALHLGNAGAVAPGATVKVTGSQLDAAAAVLRGERPEPPKEFDALRGELKASGNPRSTWRG